MTTLFLILEAVLFGIKEGILYSRKGADAFPGNEHVLFTYERITVALIAIAAVADAYLFGLTFVGYEVVAWSYHFSLFHNEAYYGCRAKIEGITYVFGYKSPSTTAKVDFSGPQRNALAAIGAVLLALHWITHSLRLRWYMLGGFVAVSGIVWAITKYRTAKRRSSAPAA
jgi:hypothetical protein